MNIKHSSKSDIMSDKALSSITRGFDYGTDVHWQDKVYLRSLFIETTRDVYDGGPVAFQDRYPYSSDIKITRFKYPLDPLAINTIGSYSNKVSSYIIDGYMYYISWS